MTIDIARCYLCKRPMLRGTKPKWIVDAATLDTLGKAHSGCRSNDYHTEWRCMHHTEEHARLMTYLFHQERGHSKYSPDELAFYLVADCHTPDSDGLTPEQSRNLDWWFTRPHDPLSPEMREPILAAYRAMLARFREARAKTTP